MGVKSLTTYLEFRSEQYFEKYELHDCNLIIDGSSLCFSLHNWNYSFLKTGYSYDCYGGDYDKYAETVKTFFQMLQACNIEPYIVFGGRNGIDRVSIIKQRLEDKMKCARDVTPDVIRERIDPSNPKSSSLPKTKSTAVQKKIYSSKPNSKFPPKTKSTNFRKKIPSKPHSKPISRFPPPSQTKSIGVALKYVFRDVLTELNLKMCTCEEDPNREIACLAKDMACPVLSANSDFFVLGSDFIPFSSLASQIVVNNTHFRNSRKKFFNYIPCKMYKIEYLLKALNKRPNNNFIPYLLPILLGSEYIKEEIFETFFERAGIIGKYRQQKIDNIFEWIKKQDSLESTLKTILDSFDNEEERKSASEQINHVTIVYSPISITSLLEHFNIKTSNCPPKSTEANGFELEKTHVERETSGSEMFIKRHRECRYPSLFIDMLKENRYFLQSNIDDCTKPDANSIGYMIMAAIHNILVQDDLKQLIVFGRNDDLKVEEYVLPVLKDQLPSIEEINYLRVEKRCDILLKILEVDENFCQIFDDFSKEWHLFLLSLKYTTIKSAIDSPFVYAVILCFIILNFVDTNLEGFYRTVDDIEHICEEDQHDSDAQGENDKFPQVTVKDSIIFMQNFVRYFEMSKEDNNETFDRGIMHSIAELQCVFLHLKYLNNLLDFPIPDAFIHKIFANTFIYNMTKKLRSVSNLKNYLNAILKECSSIHSGYFYAIKTLETHSVL